MPEERKDALLIDGFEIDLDQLNITVMYKAEGRIIDIKNYPNHGNISNMVRQVLTNYTLHNNNLDVEPERGPYTLDEMDNKVREVTIGKI